MTALIDYDDVAEAKVRRLIREFRDSDDSCSDCGSITSTLTAYSDLYPMAGVQDEDFETIDLTDLPDDSDDEGGEHTMVSNSISAQSEYSSFTKFTYQKLIMTTKLKKLKDPPAQKLYFSLFSTESKDHYRELQENCKETYVADSINPYFDKALYAAQDIEAGEFITLYEGIRQSRKESKARQRRGRTAAYTLNVGQGIIIDALGYPFGACMANHSCEPNARLRRKNLRGEEKAPYGYLQALKKIPMGSVIECDYCYLQDMDEETIANIKQSGMFVRCRCMKPSCRVVFEPFNRPQRT